MPTLPLPCLESLVGLAPVPLACFPFPVAASDAPALDLTWITDSSRTGTAGGGVYISQLAGLNFKTASTDPATDLYQRLADARTQAAQYVRQQINQAPKYGFGTPKYAAVGTLGKAGNGSVYAGGATLTLSTSNRAGGGYLVTALALATTAAAADVPVLLDGLLVATINTNTQLLPLATPFTIPFDGQAHALTATLPDGVLPLQGQLYCTTGCNSRAPGTFGESVSLSLPTVTSNTSSAGFLLSVKEQCVTAAADVLCYAATPGVNDELADALAQAVVAMSAHYFLMGLFALQNYSRYTLLDSKQLDYLGGYFKEQADKNIAWLSQPNGLGRLSNPCYSCAPNPYGPKIYKTA
jgi:hypothetical protein